jgi:hypothetical protein
MKRLKEVTLPVTILVILSLFVASYFGSVWNGETRAAAALYALIFTAVFGGIGVWFARRAEIKRQSNGSQEEGIDPSDSPTDRS